MIEARHERLSVRRQGELLGLNRSSLYYQPAVEPLARGFMYLVATWDWYSRYVLTWNLSNTLETDFCKELPFGIPP